MTANGFSKSTSRRALILAALGVASHLFAARHAEGCPFCNAVLPTFSQEREAAELVVLAEVVPSTDAANDAPEKHDSTLSIRIRQVLKGSELARKNQVLEIPRTEPLQTGALCLVLADRNAVADLSSAGAAGALRYRYRPVTEVSYGYFARAPQLRVAPAERLRYFARYLEHHEPVIANDAYLEFGHAPFDQVAQVADALPLDKMTRWLVDDAVPQERKGFYGLALGLARDPQERAQHREFLARLVLEPQDDFRAGFGGILGGYLMAGGQPALDIIDRRFLANTQSADGDVRSVLSALRFYHEYGQEILAVSLRKSLRLLLKRPEFAAEAIADLARWEDWESIEAVGALYNGPATHQPALRRAVIGFLTACPLEAATKVLEQLRQRDPKGVAEAEAHLQLLGGIR